DLPALTGTGPMTVGDKDPVKRELEALGVVASAYEPIQPKFNQFRAPASGRYKLRLRAHTFWTAPDNAKQWWHASQKNISATAHRSPSPYTRPLRKRLRSNCGTWERWMSAPNPR